MKEQNIEPKPLIGEVYITETIYTPIKDKKKKKKEILPLSNNLRNQNNYIMTKIERKPEAHYDNLWK